MGQRVVTEQVGVRAGIACGVLYVATGGVVVANLAGGRGVAALLALTVLLATTVDARHAVLVGVAGWAFATGFAVHDLGVLTWAPPDLARLTAFLLLGVGASLAGGGG